MNFNNSNNGFNNNLGNNWGNGLNNPNICGQPNANFNNNNVYNNCGNGLNNQCGFFQNNQQEAEGNKIFVTFTFKKNKKQIYIDVSENETFAGAISILEEKYEWLKLIKHKNYYTHNHNGNDKLISEQDHNKTLKDLGIGEDSDIYIIYGQVQDIKANNIHDKIKPPINIDTSDMSNNGSREIAVNFKICQKDYANDKNVIDINSRFQANKTIKDVLSGIVPNENTLSDGLQKGKFFFASKGKTQQKNEKGKMVKVEANIVLISASDLNTNMDTYINNYLKSNPSDDDKNFVIWYVEDNFYDKENPLDLQKKCLKTVNNKTNRSRKNKWLLVIGAVVLIFGAIAFAIELLVLKAALIIMIIGLFIACIGFFWGDLPCCSRLNFRMDKFDYSSGNQRNIIYDHNEKYPAHSIYNAKNL